MNLLPLAVVFPPCSIIQCGCQEQTNLPDTHRLKGMAQ